MLSLACAAFAGAASARADEHFEAPATMGPTESQMAAPAAPKLLLEATALEPMIRMASALEAAPAEVAALAEWNRQPNRPTRDGILRPLDHTRLVTLAPSKDAALMAGGLLQPGPQGELVWAGRVEVAGASRLRLRLEALDLPADARMMVYNAEGEVAGPFGLELRGPDGELWTPSIGGSTLFLEVQAPAAAVAKFAITGVLESFELDADGAPRMETEVGREITTCLVSSACITSANFANIDPYRRAVGTLRYIVNGSSYICTGALLNDNDPTSTIPYLLTANHCFSTQASTSSLEVFWDYYPSSCGGAVPTLGSRPRSNGGTLLATGAASDFTFLRLNAIPANRALLGWNTNAPINNASIYGVHHPHGEAQSFARTVVDTTPGTCTGVPASQFIYSTRAQGATLGGSSGSPATNTDLQVVGQLLGTCAFGDEPCLFGSSDNFVHGRFSSTFPSISSYLTATGSACVDGPTTLCLRNNRFKVEATYLAFDGANGPAKVVRLTQETGYLWFFDSSNIEVVVKLLDGCGLNSRFWAFAGGLTNVQVVLTITDTRSGSVTKQYSNPLGTLFAPIADTSAFATCP